MKYFFIMCTVFLLSGCQNKTYYFDCLIQCGDINCYSNSSKSDRCKNDAWIYTSFNLISGDYHQRLYLPNLKEDEYSIDSYSLQCKRVKNALDD